MHVVCTCAGESVVMDCVFIVTCCEVVHVCMFINLYHMACYLDIIVNPRRMCERVAIGLYFLFCLSAHFSYFVSGLWDGLSWSISFLLLSLAMHMYMYTCVYMYVQCNTDFAESLLSREIDNQAVNKVPFVGHCHNIAIAPPRSATPKCIHISYIWALQGEYQRAHMDPRNAKRITQALQTEDLGTRLSAFMR